jgi:hypothetical protein
VWKVILEIGLEIGRLIVEWIIQNRGTGYTQRIILTPSQDKAIYKAIYKSNIKAI